MLFSIRARVVRISRSAKCRLHIVKISICCFARIKRLRNSEAERCCHVVEKHNDVGDCYYR